MEENLSHQIKYWLTGADHDCFFTVGLENGPKEKIGVVKHILLAYSEPLRSLFKSAAPENVCLTGVEPQTFKNFLKCIYGAADTVVPSLTFEDSAKLLYLIEKYSVEALKSKVEFHMSDLMTPDCIFAALSQPACLRADGLTQQIKEIFRKDIEKILSDQRFLSLSDVTIMWIVQQELLNVQDMKIWDSVSKWAQNKVKTANGKITRPQIFNVLKNIHSSTLEITEFCKEVSEIDAGVLQKENVVEHYRLFSRPPIVHKECEHKSRQHIARCSKMSSGFLACSDGVIIMSSIKIKEIGENSEYTEWFEYNDYSWNISVVKTKDPKSYSNPENLGCFLRCFSRNTTWKCKVSFEFILLNQQSGNNFKKSVATNEFTETDRGFGYPSFYSYNSSISNYNGFLKNDSILLMLRFKCIN